MSRESRLRLLDEYKRPPVGSVWRLDCGQSQPKNQRPYFQVIEKVDGHTIMGKVIRAGGSYTLGQQTRCSAFELETSWTPVVLEADAGTTKIIECLKSEPRLFQWSNLPSLCAKGLFR